MKIALWLLIAWNVLWMVLTLITMARRAWRWLKRIRASRIPRRA